MSEADLQRYLLQQGIDYRTATAAEVAAAKDTLSLAMYRLKIAIKRFGIELVKAVMAKLRGGAHD